jgi:hypothetical protein
MKAHDPLRQWLCLGHWRRRLRSGRAVAVFLVVASCLAGAAGAQSDEDWETLSVRELMQQDLRQALDEATRSSQTGSGGGARPAPAPVRPLLAPRLVALYGVGRALMAEVQVGRDSYLYVRGQAYPAGHAGDRTVYQLRGMNGACVQLERGEDRHSLCLRMLLGEVRP